MYFYKIGYIIVVILIVIVIVHRRSYIRSFFFFLLKTASKSDSEWWSKHTVDEVDLFHLKLHSPLPEETFHLVTFRVICWQCLISVLLYICICYIWDAFLPLLHLCFALEIQYSFRRCVIVRGGSTGVARGGSYHPKKKLCHPTCHPRIITAYNINVSSVSCATFHLRRWQRNGK